MYFPKKRVIKSAPFNISFQNVKMLAVSTNNAVVFLNAPGDCGTGTYNVIVTYTNTFQDGTSATNPYMIPN